MLPVVNFLLMKNGLARSFQTSAITTQSRILILHLHLNTLTKMLKPLNRQTAAASKTRPVKVLQFGEGNFLRAFADWIIDILNETTDFNGAIQIVQPLPSGMANAINAQDGLYHVVLEGIKNGKPSKETRLITSVKGVLNPFENFGAYLA